MLQLTILAEADKDGMLLRSRAKRVAAAFGKRVGVDFVVVGEVRGARTTVSGVTKLPALLVNADVAVQGRVPSSEELASIVKDALGRGYGDLTMGEEDGYVVSGAKRWRRIWVIPKGDMPREKNSGLIAGPGRVEGHLPGLLLDSYCSILQLSRRFRRGFPNSAHENDFVGPSGDVFPGTE